MIAAVTPSGQKQTNRSACPEGRPDMKHPTSLRGLVPIVVAVAIVGGAFMPVIGRQEPPRGARNSPGPRPDDSPDVVYRRVSAKVERINQAVKKMAESGRDPSAVVGTMDGRSGRCSTPAGPSMPSPSWIVCSGSWARIRTPGRGRRDHRRGPPRRLLGSGRGRRSAISDSSSSSIPSIRRSHGSSRRCNWSRSSGRTG